MKNHVSPYYRICVLSKIFQKPSKILNNFPFFQDYRVQKKYIERTGTEKVEIQFANGKNSKTEQYQK